MTFLRLPSGDVLNMSLVGLIGDHSPGFRIVRNGEIVDPGVDVHINGERFTYHDEVAETLRAWALEAAPRRDEENAEAADEGANA